MIAYILVGLPIMMMFLANIGGIMADWLTHSYSRFCCRPCRIRRKKSEKDSNEDGDKIIPVGKEEVGFEDYMPTKLVSEVQN